jgi:ferredoxin
MSYAIKVDLKKCIGCGSCEAICPKTFVLKEGKAIALASKLEKIGCEEEAKESCPVGAILITKK